MKSRGIKNSNRVREFLITNKGIELVDIVEGPLGVLVGSARESYKIKNRIVDPEKINERKRRKIATEKKK